MSRKIVVFAISIFVMAIGCKQKSKSSTQEGSAELLSVEKFETKLAATPNAIVLDVCTPKEFEERHIKNAVNIDYNDGGFENHLSQLDKEKTYFVYCYAGGRSAKAVSLMQELGFRNIIELDGGISSWIKQNKPVENSVSRPQTGIDPNEFFEGLNSDKITLVSFNASWCSKCKQMLPILDDIEKANPSIALKRMDYDVEKKLADNLGIKAIPQMYIFKGKEKLWEHNGIISGKELAEIISKYAI